MSYDLERTVGALVAPGKGILAADESQATIAKRFERLANCAHGGKPLRGALVLLTIRLRTTPCPRSRFGFAVCRSYSLFEHWESHLDHALPERLASIPVEFGFLPTSAVEAQPDLQDD